MLLSGGVVVVALMLGFDMERGGWRSLLPWNWRLAQVEGCDLLMSSLREIVI